MKFGYQSRVQGSVTKSSTAEEFVDLSEAVSELRDILNMLSNFKKLS